MREIKFRGINNDGNWCFGDLIQSNNNHNVWIHAPKINHTYKVAPTTVGQFTGLKDCEGREIYEGDVVRVEHFGEESIHAIKYYDDMDYPAFDLDPHFDCESNGLSFCMCELETTITVIGNVHDNPELLEAKNA